jgi:tryptophanyl-tRNA synthetase
MADPDAIKDTTRRIVTDSTPSEQPKDPDACTLIALLRAFGYDSTMVETRYRNGTMGYGDAKALLAEVIEQHVAPLRHRYERLRAEPAALHERLIEGEQHTARRADQVLTRAMTAMGL